MAGSDIRYKINADFEKEVLVHIYEIMAMFPPFTNKLSIDYTAWSSNVTVHSSMKRLRWQSV